MPDAISRDANVLVGLILPKRLPPPGQIGPELRPGHFQQRTNDLARPRPNPSETHWTCTPNQPHEVRLSLIVSRVRRCDTVGSLLPSHTFEEGVPLPVPGLLDRDTVGTRAFTDVRAPDVERKRQLRGELSAESFIIDRRVTQLMIQMRKPDDGKPHGRRQLMQEQRQRHRVRAARHRHEQTPVLRDKNLSFDHALDALL